MHTIKGLCEVSLPVVPSKYHGVLIPWSPYSSSLPHPHLGIRFTTEATGYALCNCLSTDFALLLQPNAYAYGVRYMVAQMVEW